MLTARCGGQGSTLTASASRRVTPLGLLIVLCTAGIPYWHTHRRISGPHNLSEGRGYLKPTGKSPEEASAGRPGQYRDGR